MLSNLSKYSNKLQCLCTVQARYNYNVAAAVAATRSIVQCQVMAAENKSEGRAWHASVSRPTRSGAIPRMPRPTPPMTDWWCGISCVFSAAACYKAPASPRAILPRAALDIGPL